MVSAILMEEVALLAYVCQVLVVLDANQDLHVLLIHAKMVEYVSLQVSVTDVIVLQVLLAIIARLKTYAQVIHAKTAVHVIHKVHQLYVNV
jgi:hypothetical protein